MSIDVTTTTTEYAWQSLSGRITIRFDKESTMHSWMKNQQEIWGSLPQGKPIKITTTTIVQDV